MSSLSSIGRVLLSESAHSSGIEALLFLFFGLIFGIFARRLLRRVPLPYTCILLIWGLIFGIIQNAVGDGNGYHYMYQGFEYWHAMSPTLVLGVFLPILIFASGFSLDWHTVKRLKWQVLLLAGPGVIVGTILTAVVFKYVVPASVIPDINWNEALLYGAIFSATDPVAVVAVLKEVGASKDLGTLIEGESLLNDGTAYVFFIIFLARVEGHEDKAAKLVATFCQLALGGPATGLLFGIVTAYLLKHIYNDELAEVTLTISASFLCYFVADDLFKVSGVLALVFLGIYMSSVGRVNVSPRSEHAMHIVWETLEFIANTILFVFSGVMIGYSVTDKHNEVNLLTGPMIGYAIVMYIFCNLIRAVVVAMCYPLLRISGYGMDWRRATVVAFGGLRGAVGLALALIVKLNDKVKDSEFKSVLLLHMGVVCVLTLLINASLTPTVLKLVGLRETSPAKIQFLDYATRNVDAIMEETLELMRYGNLEGDPDWDEVKSLVALLPPSHENEDHRIAAKTKSDGGTANDTNGDGRSGGGKVRSFKPLTVAPSINLSEREALTDTRSKYMSIVKSSYAEGLEKEYISARTHLTLSEIADKSIDRLRDPISDFQHLETELQLPIWFRLCQRVVPEKVYKNWLLPLLLQRFNALATAYLFAHREASSKVGSLLSSLMTAQEGDGDDGQEGNLVNSNLVEAYRQVIRESDRCIRHISLHIHHMRIAYPEVLTAIKTKLVSRTVLMHMDRYLNKLRHSGLVEAKDLADLQDAIDSRVAAVVNMHPRARMRSSRQVLRSSELLCLLNDEEFDSLLPKDKVPVVYHGAGQVIYDPATQAGTVVVLLRGLAQRRLPDGKSRRDSFETITGNKGTIAWMKAQERTTSIKKNRAIMPLEQTTKTVVRENSDLQVFDEMEEVSSGRMLGLIDSQIDHHHGGPGDAIDHENHALKPFVASTVCEVVELTPAMLERLLVAIPKARDIAIQSAAVHVIQTFGPAMFSRLPQVHLRREVRSGQIVTLNTGETQTYAPGSVFVLLKGTMQDGGDDVSAPNFVVSRDASSTARTDVVMIVLAPGLGERLKSSEVQDVAAAPGERVKSILKSVLDSWTLKPRKTPKEAASHVASIWRSKSRRAEDGDAGSNAGTGESLQILLPSSEAGLAREASHVTLEEAEIPPDPDAPAVP